MSREAEKGSIEYAVTQLQTESVEPTTAPEVEPEALEETPEIEEQETVLETTEDEPQGELEEEESELQTSEVEEEVTEEEETEDYYAVKIDGEEYQVTHDELIGGYQRQKDYTKKTQAVADDRKANDARKVELEKLYTEFLTQSQQANELLNRDLKKLEAVDWTALKEDDPTAYVQKTIEVQEARQAKADIAAQAQRVYEHNQEAQAVAKTQHMELQRKEALKLFPEWKSDKTANANQVKIIEYARSIGYNDSELSNIVNAKDLLLLDKARRYDDLQTTKQGITQKKRPAIRKMVKAKGIAPVGAKKTKAIEESRGRLHKSGSLQDAARFLYEAREAKATKQR
jgi:hypothetical protein